MDTTTAQDGTDQAGETFHVGVTPEGPMPDVERIALDLLRRTQASHFAVRLYVERLIADRDFMLALDEYTPDWTTLSTDPSIEEDMRSAGWVWGHGLMAALHNDRAHGVFPDAGGTNPDLPRPARWRRDEDEAIAHLAAHVALWRRTGRRINEGPQPHRRTLSDGIVEYMQAIVNIHIKRVHAFRPHLPREEYEQIAYSR